VMTGWDRVAATDAVISSVMRRTLFMFSFFR
jgi:hypothetical protein